MNIWGLLLSTVLGNPRLSSAVLLFFWFLLLRTGPAGFQRVLQVDLEMNILLGRQGRQEVSWQLEYPLSQTVTPEVTTRIHLAHQDLGGIVPLAMVRRSSTHTHTHTNQSS